MRVPLFVLLDMGSPVVTGAVEEVVCVGVSRWHPRSNKALFGEQDGGRQNRKGRQQLLRTEVPALALKTPRARPARLRLRLPAPELLFPV